MESLNSPTKKKSLPYSDFQIFLFVVALCLLCALLLAVSAYALKNAQDAAKEFDQSKQMLIAAKILNPKGYFEIWEKNGFSPAEFDVKQNLLVRVEGESARKASDEEIKKISEVHIRPLLVDNGGNVFTLEEKQIALSAYLEENKKVGYAALPLKLFYAILPNEKGAENISATDISRDLTKAHVFVFPVSGFGLWAPIYGYLAVSENGETVMGTTWYEHGETPGLGANITEPWWQKQFFGKDLFQQTSNTKIDLQSADMGIIVVKGKVQNVFGNAPRAKSAVDGISGATLTGDGVTAAYRNSLSPYRPLLIKLHESSIRGKK